MRFNLAKCGKDAFHHTVGISKDVVVPESNDLVSLTFEPRRAFCAAPNLSCVLATIDFDDEFALGADEIDDVSSDRGLPAKEEPIELTSAQPRPQALLSLSWVLSKPPRNSVCHGAILPPSLTFDGLTRPHWGHGPISTHKGGGDFPSTPLGDSLPLLWGRVPWDLEGASNMLPPP